MSRSFSVIVRCLCPLSTPVLQKEGRSGADNVSKGCGADFLAFSLMETTPGRRRDRRAEMYICSQHV